MKLKLITASLLLAALPLAAQADPATDRALQLSEPLSSTAQDTAVSNDVSLSYIAADGGSAAMSAARIKLNNRKSTHFADAGSSQALAHDAVRG